MPGRRRRIGRYVKRRLKNQPKIQDDTINENADSNNDSNVQLDESVIAVNVLDPLNDLMATSISRLSNVTNWYVERQGDDIRIFKLRHNTCNLTESSLPPIVISRLLIVKADGSWAVFIEGLLLKKSSRSVKCIPDILCSNSLTQLIDILQTFHVCPGNADSHLVSFCEERKGKFFSVTRHIVASLHGTDTGLSTTIRHCSCHILVQTKDKRCATCIEYRVKLRAMYSRFKKQQDSKIAINTNDRYLRTPEMMIRRLARRRKVRNTNARNKRLQRKLDSITKNHGVTTDVGLQSDILEVINNYQVEISEGFGDSDFRKIFWKQQVSATKAKSRHGIRWHPLFIRWCINIMISSPRTYNVMRESNVLQLPSQRTLKDYTHWFKPEIGFQMETFLQLYEDYNMEDLNEAEKHVVLGFDEMKIHEGLVFNSKTGMILGFVDTGDMNARFKEFEAHVKGKEHLETEVATHMLALCVRGIFMKLDYPIGQFPTSTISGQELCDIVWTGVRRLMEIGITVAVIVADGISTNRKFFKLHTSVDGQREGVTYRVKNIYNPTSYIWFMSDVCHLMKTTRNCWERSSKNGSRHLENNGKHILWSHLINIYDKSLQESGLYIGHKLKLEHIKLNSYSRMNVRLAAQVLSKSVADLFNTFRHLDDDDQIGYKDTTETEIFCRMFNRFFDCLNTRNLYEAEHKRNDDLRAYTDPMDERLKWLQEDFLTYLENWKLYAMSQEGMTYEDKKKLQLSEQTLEGIKITVYSFLEVIPFLLSLDGARFIFSGRFNQDNVEVFFGKQRARCGRSDNPTIEQFIYNTQTIRTGRKLSYGWSSSIQKKRKSNDDYEDPLKPLRKRRKCKNSD